MNSEGFHQLLHLQALQQQPQEQQRITTCVSSGTLCEETRSQDMKPKERLMMIHSIILLSVSHLRF